MCTCIAASRDATEKTSQSAIKVIIGSCGEVDEEFDCDSVLMER